MIVHTNLYNLIIFNVNYENDEYKFVNLTRSEILDKLEQKTFTGDTYHIKVTRQTKDDG